MRKVGIPRHEARVLTWNINGLRKVAAGHGGLKGLLDQFGADIGKFLTCNDLVYVVRPVVDVHHQLDGCCVVLAAIFKLSSACGT